MRYGWHGMAEWDDLGDDELRCRLLQRGCTREEADVIVERRDDCDDVRTFIRAVLRGHD